MSEIDLNLSIQSFTYANKNFLSTHVVVITYCESVRPRDEAC